MVKTYFVHTVHYVLLVQKQCKVILECIINKVERCLDFDGTLELKNFSHIHV